MNVGIWLLMCILCIAGLYLPDKFTYIKRRLNISHVHKIDTSYCIYSFVSTHGQSKYGKLLRGRILWLGERDLNIWRYKDVNVFYYNDSRLRLVFSFELIHTLTFYSTMHDDNITHAKWFNMHPSYECSRNAFIFCRACWHSIIVFLYYL